MSLLIPEDLPDCIDKPIEEAITPVAQGIGKTISDLWFLAMGGISQIADKKRIKYAHDLEELKKSLEKKTDDIPIEYRIEPDTQIACQALEDAKYCAGNEDIREMFANLIASTMDNRLCEYIHPSFSGILRQMTSEEAKFLMKIRQAEILPVCNILVTSKKSGRYSIIFNDFYVETIAPSEQVIVDNAFILSSLTRQGLIEISYNRQMANDGVYNIFKESVFFKSHVEWEEQNGTKTVTLQKGGIVLTHAGKRFLKACCPLSPDTRADVISSDLGLKK